MAVIDRETSRPPVERPTEPSTDVPERPPWWPRWADGAAVAVALAAGLVLRFVTRSPLWLDEALSVNIARLPLGDIPEALRHDGHPPLYYFLLHGWMALFGRGDGAVRALSGLFGLALFPLMWIGGRRLAGRRGAWGAVLILALSPYAIRYSTETRMYSLVMVLALAAWLIAEDALERPTALRLGALTLISGALLLTHYWAMWLLGAVGLALIVHWWRARRAGDTVHQRAAVRVLVAVAAGGILFLPWVTSLLYQSAHTGTPWAGPVRPSDVVARTMADLGGGPEGEAIVLGVILVVLVLLALFGRPTGSRGIQLDLATRVESRPLLVVISLTVGIAVAAGYATSSTFATRYMAVLVPMVLLVATLGLARFSGGLAFRLVLAAVLVLGAAGGLRNAIRSRTQAEVVGEAIAARAGPRDLVITCPDQLGPALSRTLPEGVDAVSYPDFGPIDRVDWVDYTDRLDRASPKRFARAALRRAEGRPIWLVWAGSYSTHEKTCERLLTALTAARPDATNPVPDEGAKYFEHESVFRFPAP